MNETIRSCTRYCDESLSRLRRLGEYHLRLDPMHRRIEPDEETYVLRLRKALLHIVAIEQWEVTPDILHVIGPELRVAYEQLDGCIDELPQELRELVHGTERSGRVGSRREWDETQGEFLSRFFHPTPVRLVLGTDMGGMGPASDLICYGYILLHLALLNTRYCVALKGLAAKRRSLVEFEVDGLLLEIFEKDPPECLTDLFDHSGRDR